MTFQFADNASAKLASAITSGDVTLNVVTGQGAQFPTPAGGAVFRATLISSTALEIVEVTARSSDTFTIVRAKEGTTAVAFAAGDNLKLFLTKEVMEACYQRGEIDTDGTLAANSDTVLASQKATKTYVDAKVAGLSWKQAVRSATTAPGTLSSSFENGDTIDGVTLATGNRILIKNQSSGAENGIYTVNASGAPTRTTDADSGAELVNATVYVSEGTANADTQWTCTTNATISLGSTSLAFAQLTSGTGTTLDGLSDVTVPSPSTGDFLRWSGSAWVNQVAVENDVGASTHDAGNTSTAITIDWSLARVQKCTATGSFTLTHSNMVAGLVYTLEVLTGAGSFTATFSSTDWGSASAPTLTVTASKRDTFTFYKSIGATISGAVFSQACAP